MPALCLQKKSILMSVIILSTVSINVYVFYVQVSAFSHLVYKTLVSTRITIYQFINIRNMSDVYAPGRFTNRFQMTGYCLNCPEVSNVTTTTMFVDRGCEESSFIECHSPSTNHLMPQNSIYLNRTLQVVFLPQPHWLNKSVFNFSTCKFNKCHFEGSKVTARTDVVIVQADYLTSNHKLPSKRWNHQLYILAMCESAIYTVADVIMNNSLIWRMPFNMTLTYRPDSDMFVPYKFRFHKKPLDRRPKYYEIAKNKTKTAVWFVRDCKTRSNRDGYVKEVKKYVDVDIFDNCGKTGNRSPCTNILTSTYKFYLSLETPECQDYMADQMFQLFDPGVHIIPVVKGGADYVKHFPKNVYIDAAQYKTATELAKHLKYLASDLEMYSKYLQYKDLYQNVAGGSLNTLCALCQFLHTNKPKLYGLHSWADFLRCYNSTNT